MTCVPHPTVCRCRHRRSHITALHRPRPSPAPSGPRRSPGPHLQQPHHLLHGGHVPQLRPHQDDLPVAGCLGGHRSALGQQVIVLFLQHGTKHTYGSRLSSPPAISTLCGAPPMPAAMRSCHTTGILQHPPSTPPCRTRWHTRKTPGGMPPSPFAPTFNASYVTRYRPPNPPEMLPVPTHQVLLTLPHPYPHPPCTPPRRTP